MTADGVWQIGLFLYALLFVWLWAKERGWKEGWRDSHNALTPRLTRAETDADFWRAISIAQQDRAAQQQDKEPDHGG